MFPICVAFWYKAYILLKDYKTAVMHPFLFHIDFNNSLPLSWLKKKKLHNFVYSPQLWHQPRQKQLSAFALWCSCSSPVSFPAAGASACSNWPLCIPSRRLSAEETNMREHAWETVGERAIKWNITKISWTQSHMQYEFLTILYRFNFQFYFNSSNEMYRRNGSGYYK